MIISIKLTCGSANLDFSVC